MATDSPEVPKGKTKRLAEDDAGRPLKKTGHIEGDRPRKHYVLRKWLRRLWSLVALALVVVGGWIVYQWAAKGKPPDLTSERGRNEALDALKSDVNKAADASKPYVDVAAAKAREFYEYTLDDLQKRLKGKPPESREEITKLVKESEEATRNDPSPWDKTKPADAGAKTGGTPDEPRVTNLPEKNPATPATGYLAEAQAAFQAGSKAYAQTDPANSQETVQVHVRIAKRFFEKSLTLIDRARAAGQGSAQLDALEEKVTKRLYDCNKRIEIKPEYDRKFEATWPRWQ